MLREIYLLLKQHLTTNVSALKFIDWDLNQYALIGEDHVLITPSLYIGFAPITWDTHPRKMQRAVLEFSTTLINDTAYGDDRDMVDTTYINHLAIESSIFANLMGKRFLLSDLPGFEILAGTSDDRVMMETITRTRTEPHNELDKLAVSTQTFHSVIFDYSAQPATQKVMATLNCTLIN